MPQIGSLSKILQELPRKKVVPVAQMAWVMAKGVIPIPGTTKIERAASNFAAKDITWSKEHMEKFESLGSQVKGLRGDESYMGSTYHSQMKT